MKQVLFGTLLLCAALAGCNSDAELAGNGIGTPTNPAEVEESPTAFNIANQCVAIQSLANDRFISMNSDGSYGVSQATAVNASPFYLKPTALGKYMIYNRDKAMMRAVGSTAGTPRSAGRGGSPTYATAGHQLWAAVRTLSHWADSPMASLPAVCCSNVSGTMKCQKSPSL